MKLIIHRNQLIRIPVLCTFGALLGFAVGTNELETVAACMWFTPMTCWFIYLFSEKEK